VSPEFAEFALEKVAVALGARLKIEIEETQRAA